MKNELECSILFYYFIIKIIHFEIYFVEYSKMLFRMFHTRVDLKKG